MARKKNDTDEIERDIEDTRDRIDSTLSELGDRLSPGQLLDQALDHLRDGAAGPRRFASNLGRSIQDNPLPVALVGIGLAWLAFGRNGSDRRYAWSDPDELAGEDDGPGRLERFGHAASGTAAAAGERMRHAGERMRHARERAHETRARLGGSARRGATRARSAWSHMIDEQPLVLGLAGLALGAALGGSLPATEREDEWMGEMRDDVVRRGAEAARETAASAREQVEQMGEREVGGVPPAQPGAPAPPTAPFTAT